MKKSLFIIALLIALSVTASAQFVDRITRPCPGASTRAFVQVNANGSISVVTCAGQAFTVNGAPVAGGGITGGGTAGKIPIFASPTSIGNSVITDITSAYALAGRDWQIDNAKFIVSRNTSNLQRRLIGLDAANVVQIGIDITAGGVQIGNAASTAQLRVTPSTGTSILGNATGGINQMQLSIVDPTSIIRLSGAGGTSFTLNDATQIISFNSGTANVNSTGDIELRQLRPRQTLTPAGITGPQTIDLGQGSVNIAPAGTNIKVTNSLASTTSIVGAWALTNDATCSVKNIVRAAGSFTVNMTAACTAETTVGFIVSHN